MEKNFLSLRQLFGQCIHLFQGKWSKNKILKTSFYVKYETD